MARPHLSRRAVNVNNQKIYEAGPIQLLLITPPAPPRLYSSPHQVNHLNDARYHCSEDPDNHEERLFLTPLRPRPVIEPYFTQPAVNKRAFNEDFFLDNSELANNPEDSQQSLLEIDQKVEFSEEEELLLPLTP